MMPDCDREGRIFQSTRQTPDRSLLISERRSFNNAVTSIAGLHHIVMSLLCHLMTSLRSVTKPLTMAYLASSTTSPYQTRENFRFLSYPG